MTIGRRKKLKKEKVITLRMNKQSFDIIQEFAEARGISVNSYLNSVANAQAEWFIPLHSYEMVSISKKLFSRLFESVNDDNLERMAQDWVNEGKNAALLECGALTLESVIELQQKVAKYWVGSDIKITILNNPSVPDTDTRTVGRNASDDTDEAKDSRMDNDIIMILRHNMGRNFSIFWTRSSLLLFNLLGSRKVSVSYDTTTVSIRLDVLR